MGMPKKGASRGQMNIAPPKDLRLYIDELETDDGPTRTRRSIAGLCAFECLTLAQQKSLLKWASALESGDIVWADVLDYGRKEKGRLLDHKRLDQSRRLYKDQRSKAQERRPAS